MRFCALIFVFMLSGCDFLSQNTPVQSGKKTVTCKMNNFKGFPKKVTGPVVFELTSTITIGIFNKDESERVDMTFPKDKCR